ncbi:hypothetical protein ABK040_010381 [Willaertia magna]
MQLFKLEENQTTLQQVGTRNIKEIKVINYGKSHFTIITKQDDIYVYGNNDYGKLGTGNNLSVNELTKINYDTKTFIRNIKHLICGDTFTIIGTTKSELFFTGHLSYFYDSFKFIKLKHFINNLEIKFISNGRTLNNNEYYFSGKNVFGIPNDKCKYFDSGYGFNSHYYVDKFTKINLFNDLFNNNNNNEMKYCYPILMTEEKLVIYLNYKIFYGNKVCEDEVTLGLKCLEKTTSIQLTDLTFNF